MNNRSLPNARNRGNQRNQPTRGHTKPPRGQRPKPTRPKPLPTQDCREERLMLQEVSQLSSPEAMLSTLEDYTRNNRPCLSVPVPTNTNNRDCSNMCGDATNDSVINILDVVQIVSTILGNADLNNCSHQMDYNRDGVINVLDIAGIMSVIMDEEASSYECDGTIVPPPPPEVQCDSDGECEAAFPNQGTTCHDEGPHNGYCWAGPTRICSPTGANSTGCNVSGDWTNYTHCLQYNASYHAGDTETSYSTCELPPVLGGDCWGDYDCTHLGASISCYGGVCTDFSDYGYGDDVHCDSNGECEAVFPGQGTTCHDRGPHEGYCWAGPTNCAWSWSNQNSTGCSNVSGDWTNYTYCLQYDSTGSVGGEVYPYSTCELPPVLGGDCWGDYDCTHLDAVCVYGQCCYYDGGWVCG